MNWQTSANIALTVQTFVIAVSVVFIWLQLRRQTRLARVANTQALVEISSPFNLELIKDPAIAALWINGARDYETFDEVKQYQYRSLLIWRLIFQENVFYQCQEGLLDKNIYASWDYDLQLFITQQNLKVRWTELKDMFQTEFRNYVTGLVEK
jgi:hypothetical protein